MRNSLLSLFLVLGFLFNVACVLIFKIRSENQRRDFQKEVTNTLNLNISRIVTDLYKHCDEFLRTNDFRVVVSNSPPISLPSSDTNTPLYTNVGSWDFLYYTFNNEPFARVGNRDYSIGDFFPRGGVITDIHPDGVSIDYKYWVSNVRFPLSSSLSPSSQLSSKPQTKELPHVRPMDTLR